MTATTNSEASTFSIQEHAWHGKTSKNWITALMKRLRQKYEQQVYWIKCEYDGSESGALADLPDRDTLILKGWLKVYVRPGNNEAHVVIMEWERHKFRPTDPHDMRRLLTIKDDHGFEHALDIARWLTLAVY